MKIIKIGETNFQEFKTEFFTTERIKKYFEENKISLAMLIPNAYRFYEQNLFDEIEDSKPHRIKRFQVIYYGIVIGRDFNKGKLNEKGFEEELPEEIMSKKIYQSNMNPTDLNFVLKYLVKTKN